MLKRNKVLVAFMLVAVLCMSIGFAAISDTLYVNGSMSLELKDGGTLDEEFDSNVYFVSAMATTANVTTSSITADDAGDENDKYTFVIDPVAFAKAGDSVTITVGVKNENTAAAKLTLSSVVEGALADFITVTPTLAQTVAANGTETLTIVVTLDSIPQTASTSSISFTIDAIPAA